MTKIVFSSFFVWVIFNVLHRSEAASNKNAPQVETPVLLNSYLPAAMQVIAHLTDLMKYDVKPAEPSTTTPKPTSPHRPAIFAPSTPRTIFDDQGRNFDLTKESREGNQENQYVIGPLPEDLYLLGYGPSQILKTINVIEDNSFLNEEEQAERFLDKHDDYNVKQYVIGNKKTPPTRAYVTLLSLYDQLNNEAKKLKLNKYGGYTPLVLKFLEENSAGTSGDQLRSVLSKMIENRDTDNGKILEKTNNVLKDLDSSNSYIHLALRYIPPLRFEFII